MGVIRSVAAGGLVVSLLVTLLAANVAVGADRTALNAGFTKTTLEEENAYRTAQSIVVDRVEERVQEAAIPIPESVDVNRTVREVLTRAYLENQTERNVERVYDYLHGRRDDLTIALNTTPVRENLAAVIETRIRNMTVSEMIDFVSTQENLSVSVSGVRINLSAVGDMAQSRADYREARRSLREEIREEVEDEFPPGTPESEINRTVNRTLQSIAEQIEGQVRSLVQESVPETFQPAADAAADMVMVGVRGLTTDMSYATFSERLAEAKDALAENASTVVANRLDAEVEDRITLHERLPPSALNRLETARTAVGVLDLLVYALPLFGLLLVGLLYLLTRSISATALGTGIALSVAGGASYLVASIAPGMVRSRVSTVDLPEGAVDVALGVVEQVAGAFGAQSLALLVLGVVLIAVGIALWYRNRGESADVTPTETSG